MIASKLMIMVHSTHRPIVSYDNGEVNDAVDEAYQSIDFFKLFISFATFTVTQWVRSRAERRG